VNREQKSAAIAQIASQIEESQAIFAVDYRGISVPQVAELRGRLRDADATFKVVKNSLTERAADASGAETLKELLIGPTALTFVRGDAATAAKAIADYGRATQLLPFKGGIMDGSPLDVEQIRALSRLPSREVLYGQLVGVVASPVSGLVRTLNALLGGLAAALGQVRDKMDSGEIPSAAPAADETAAAPEAAAAEEAPQAEQGGEAAQAPQAEQEPQAAEARTTGEPEAAPAEEATAEPEPEAAEPDAEAEPQPDAAGEAQPATSAAQAASEEGEGGADDDKQADGPTGEQSADDTSNKED
jgi:large subunit ribosomal protein L10